MLRKLVPVLALIAAPAIASAQFEAGDYDLTLGGTLSAPKAVTTGAVAVQAQLGYLLTKEAEVGIGQSVTYLDSGASGSIPSTTWGGMTEGFVNYYFDMGAWQPFIGGVAAYTYPNGATGSWALAPVLGVKYFVNGTTYVFADVQYNYTTTAPSQSFFSGALGVGFRF